MKKLLLIPLLCSLTFAQGIGGKAGVGGSAGFGTGAAASEPTFTHIQGGPWGGSASSGTTISATLTSPPTAGNAIVCKAAFFPSSSVVSSAVDNAGSPNSYTVAPTSSGVQTGIPGLSFFYLLNAPSGAGSTITATISATITFFTDMSCEEFNRSSGTWTYDTVAANNSASASSCTTPTITPAVSGELLYGACATGNGGAFISSANSPWTLDGAGIQPSEGFAAGEYILTSSGSPGINFTINTAAKYNGLVMALK